MFDGWHEQEFIDRWAEALLVPCLFLAGEEASLVGTADSRCYAQEHHHHHQHSQYNPDNIDVICGLQSTARSCRFLYTQDTCVCGTLTDLHLLRQTLGVSCVVLRSAVVFACVVFPDGDEFLQCMGMFRMQIYYDKMALNFAHTNHGMHCFSSTQIDFCSWNGLKKLNLGMLFNEWGMERYNLKYTVNSQRGQKHNIWKWLWSVGQLDGAEEDNLW